MYTCSLDHCHRVHATQVESLPIQSIQNVNSTAQVASGTDGRRGKKKTKIKLIFLRDLTRVWGHWWWCPGTRLSVSGDALSVSGDTGGGVRGPVCPCPGTLFPCLGTLVVVSGDPSVRVRGRSLRVWGHVYRGHVSFCVRGHVCLCLGTRLSVYGDTSVRLWGYVCPCLGTRLSVSGDKEAISLAWWPRCAEDCRQTSVVTLCRQFQSRVGVPPSTESLKEISVTREPWASSPTNSYFRIERTWYARTRARA